MTRLQISRLRLARTASGTGVGMLCPQHCQANGRSGRIGVYSIHHKTGFTTRYLQCRVCGWKPEPNKLVEPDPEYRGGKRSTANGH